MMTILEGQLTGFEAIFKMTPKSSFRGRGFLIFAFPAFIPPVLKMTVVKTQYVRKYVMFMALHLLGDSYVKYFTFDLCK